MTSNVPENFAFVAARVLEKSRTSGNAFVAAPSGDRFENRNSVLQKSATLRRASLAKISSRNSTGKSAVPALPNRAMQNFLPCIRKRTINGVVYVVGTPSHSACSESLCCWNSSKASLISI